MHATSSLTGLFPQMINFSASHRQKKFCLFSVEAKNIYCFDQNTFKFTKKAKGVLEEHQISSKFKLTSDFNLKQVLWRDDGQNLAAVGDSQIEVWEDKKSIFKYSTKDPQKNIIKFVEWNILGNSFAVAFSKSTEYEIVNLENQEKEPLRVFTKHRKPVTILAWNFKKHKLRIASAGEDCWVRVWDVNEKKESGSFYLKNSPTSLKWSRDSNKIATTDSGKSFSIKIWDTTNFALLSVLIGHEFTVSNISWNPEDSDQIASGSLDGTLRIWNLRQSAMEKKVLGVKVAFLEWREAEIIGADTSGKIYQFDAKTNFSKSLQMIDNSVLSQWSNKSNCFTVAEVQRKTAGNSNLELMKIYEVYDEEEDKGIVEKAVLKAKLDQKDSQHILSAEWSFDDRFLAISSTQFLYVWSIEKKVFMWSLPVKDCHCILSSSPNSNQFVAGDYQGFISIYDYEREEPEKSELLTKIDTVIEEKNQSKKKTKKLSINNVISNIFWGNLSGSSVLFVQDWKSNIQIFEDTLAKDTPIMNFSENNISTFAVNKEGTRMVIGSLKGLLVVYNLIHQKKQFILKGHEGYVTSVNFDSNGKEILSGDWNGNIFVWDTRYGTLEKRIQLLKSNIFQLWSGNLIITKEESYPISRIKVNSKQKIMIITQDKKMTIGDMVDIYKENQFLNFIFNILKDYKTLDTIILHVSKDVCHELIKTKLADEYGELSFTIFHILAYYRMEEELMLLIGLCYFYSVYPSYFPKDSKGETILSLLLKKKTKNELTLPILLDFQIECYKRVRINNFDEDLKNILHLLEMKYFDQVIRIFEVRFKPVTYTFPEAMEIPHQDNEDDVITHSLDYIGNLNEFEKEAEDSKTVENETKVLDIPLLKINPETKNIFKIIAQLPYTHPFYSSSALLSLIDYKWNLYGKRFFARYISIYAVFLILVTINFIFLFPVMVQSSDDELETYQDIFLTTLSLTLLFLVYLIYDEFLEFRVKVKQGNNIYFSSLWNWIDIMNLSANFFIVIVVFCLVLLGTPDSDAVKLAISFCLFLTYVKIFDFFRSSKKASFLVRIILNILKETQMFLAMLFLFLIIFSITSKVFIIFK